MTDDQLTEWCVARVKEWLATGHPSAWRAWPEAYPKNGRQRHLLRIYALLPRGKYWSYFPVTRFPVILHTYEFPEGTTFLQASQACHAATKQLPLAATNSIVVTEADRKRLLEEAAAIATNPADWRPVEMLPEDYYAL